MKILLALAALLLPCAALADCTFTVTTMSFGAYDVFATSPLDSVATITYSCIVPAASPSISASAGSAGTYSPRKMAGPGGNLSYNLFVDSGRASVFGDGTGGTSTIAPSIGANLTATIYGRVPARQNLSIGAYSDSVTLTLMF
jgi:spore coat protein U-like protein